MLYKQPEIGDVLEYGHLDRKKNIIRAPKWVPVGRVIKISGDIVQVLAVRADRLVYTDLYIWRFPDTLNPALRVKTDYQK